MRLMRLFCFAVLISLPFLGACEESVNPILESDRQFTLFGTLDMNQDTQYVRVIPIRPVLATDSEAPLNVSFTSTNLVTGETVAWRDSMVQFSEGLFGHVFYAPLRVRPGHTYRIDVQSPESNLVTSAQTTLPAQPEPIVVPETIEFIFTTQLRATQQVIWRGISSEPFEIQHWYRFFTVADFGFQDVAIPFRLVHGPAEGESDAWAVSLNLVRDRDTLDTLIEIDNGTSLAGLGMTITLLDDAFVPPGGAFDPDVLSQPGTLSNVENGFGFLGSVGRFSVEWLLADTSARALSYIPIGQPFARESAERPEQLKQEAAGGD